MVHSLRRRPGPAEATDQGRLCAVRESLRSFSNTLPLGGRGTAIARAPDGGGYHHPYILHGPKGPFARAVTARDAPRYRRRLIAAARLICSHRQHLPHVDHISTSLR